jgi:dTDP-4-amino-4,6-dideoxygalactose transaminase
MNHIKIPYENLKLVNEPYLDSLVKVSKETIENGWYILGKQVEKFENEFAKVNKIQHCIGVASGLDALILGLSVFDFPKGAKVLVASNSYIACILSIIRSDLIPVLVEPNFETYNIDTVGLEKYYTNDCVAILAVHMYGRMCPMPEIIQFARDKNMKVVEDCAQSHFAQIDSINAGCYGDIGAFSFYPTKNLGALGDAGAIICKDKDIFEKLKALRNYGSNLKYHNKYIGFNSRLDEIQAAFLMVKLFDYKKVIEHKRKLVSIYLEKLKDVLEIKLPLEATEDHVWHIFNILTPKRDKLKEFLLQNGIGTEIHYPVSPNNQEGYKPFFDLIEFPISEEIHRNTLSLPLSICHSENDVIKVSEKILLFFN